MGSSANFTHFVLYLRLCPGDLPLPLDGGLRPGPSDSAGEHHLLAKQGRAPAPDLADGDVQGGQHEVQLHRSVPG